MRLFVDHVISSISTVPMFDWLGLYVVVLVMVQVVQGPQQGQSGVVTAVLRRQNRIIIDGVNMVSSPAPKPSTHPPNNSYVSIYIYVCVHAIVVAPAHSQGP
jgi:hypothetical protein